jgi:hypothetical protein
MATRQKIGFPKGGGDVNVTNWLRGVLKRSRVDTKRTMSVAQHFESDADLYGGCKNPAGTLIYRLDKLSIRFASSRETPAEDAARVHALNLR